MNSSKFFLSTLIAAAAMTAPAYATNYTVTDNSSTLIDAGSGDTVTIDFSSNENSYLYAGNDVAEYTINANVVIENATIHNGSSDKTYTFNGTITGEGAFYYQANRGSNNQTYIFNGDVSGYSGNMTIASGKNGTFTFTNKTGTGTITAENASSVLNLNGATVNNSEINVSTINISGATSFAAKPITLTGNVVVAADSEVTVSGALTLSSAISNSGTITFGEGASLALTGFTPSSVTGLNENATSLQTVVTTYTIATGGTVSGLTTANVTVNGAGVTSVSGDGLSATMSESVYNIGTNGDPVSYSSISPENLAAAAYINVAGTLDYGTTATGGTLAGGNFLGNGLVKWKNTQDSHGTTVVISDGFSGTLQLTGNITSGNPLALGGTQSLVLDGVWFWGESVSTIRAATVLTDTYSITNRAQNVHFYLDGSGVSFTNSFDAEGKTVYLAQGTTTFAGDTKIGTLNLSGGSATISGSISADLKKIGTSTLTVSGSVASGSTLEIAEGSATINSRQDLGATIKVSSGTLSFSGGENESFNANLEIGGGNSSVVVNAGWTDQVGRSDFGESYIKVGKNGEFAMGSKRWGLVSTKKVILENGGKISGTGDSWGALDFDGANTISATGTGNEVSANIRLRAGALTFDVDADSDLTFSGVFNPNEKTTKQNGIIKSGTGTLTLSGDNSGVNYGSTTISAGTLEVANASALGTGKTTVNAGATLTFATTVSGVTGGVEINEGATFAIDLTDFTQTASEGDEIGFTILTNTALTFNGQGAITLSSGDIERYFDVEGSTLGDYSEWAREWSYNTDSNTLSLTMTIPEPSAFGLLTGVGALALVVSRRKRRK